MASTDDVGESSLRILVRGVERGGPHGHRDTRHQVRADHFGRDTLRKGGELCVDLGAIGQIGRKSRRVTPRGRFARRRIDFRSAHALTEPPQPRTDPWTEFLCKQSRFGTGKVVDSRDAERLKPNRCALADTPQGLGRSVGHQLRPVIGCNSVHTSRFCEPSGDLRAQHVVADPDRAHQARTGRDRCANVFGKPLRIGGLGAGKRFVPTENLHW